MQTSSPDGIPVSYSAVLPSETNSPTGRLSGYLRENPELRSRFARLRRHTAPLLSSNYDISRTCNLRCEGCLFFEGSDYVEHADDKTEAEWDRFFSAERARGITFPYLAGAEPALQQKRLRIAAQYFTRGVIFTNGSVRIDPAIPFTIHISLWGTPEKTTELRGANSFWKAIHNYKNDERARFVYTVNPRNIADIDRVVEICATAGVKLTFSLFSPTSQYREKISTGAENDNAYFRTSSKGDHLGFDEISLLETRERLNNLIVSFPKTVLYSKSYNAWVTNPTGLYDIDPETGWATDCASLNSLHHEHFRTDLTSSDSKCCSPNIDCLDCRAYAMALGTVFSRFRRFTASKEQFLDWLEIAEHWASLFLYDWDRCA